jgi:hypothetical protein
MIWQGMTLAYRLAYIVPVKTSLQTNKMPTAFPLRVQAIRSRGQNPRLYVSFPLALAAAIGLEPGEEVQWELLDRGELHLVRPNPTPPTTKSRVSK